MMRKAMLWGGAALAVGSVALTAARVAPLPRLPLPNPAPTYPAATARLDALEAAEQADILPVCRARLWSSGQATGTVVVLLHGYTNCPHQFDQLGAFLHEAGHTVYAPRLPVHGQVDRMTRDLGTMSPEMLRTWLGEVLDIAAGLGDQVIVLGFSFGGVLAGWAAQQRVGLAHVVLASASLGLTLVPRWARRVAASSLPRLPDRFVWWDPVRKEEKLGPKHGYLGISTRGIGVLMRLGNGLLSAAQHDAPLSTRITLALNPSDTVVDNEMAVALGNAWHSHGADVTVFHFGTKPPLIHDYMDPDQVGAQVERVYPVLAALIAGESPPREGTGAPA